MFVVHMLKLIDQMSHWCFNFNLRAGYLNVLNKQTKKSSITENAMQIFSKTIFIHWGTTLHNIIFLLRHSSSKQSLYCRFAKIANLTAIWTLNQNIRLTWQKSTGDLKRSKDATRQPCLPHHQSQVTEWILRNKPSICLCPVPVAGITEQLMIDWRHTKHPALSGHVFTTKSFPLFSLTFIQYD